MVLATPAPAENRLVRDFSHESNSHIPLCPVSSFRAFSLNLKDFLKAVVRDSIIMNSARIGKNTVLDRAIIAEGSIIGENCVLGAGEDDIPNKLKPDVYAFNLVTVGEKTVIPDGVTIGKNTAIAGKTTIDDYPDNTLAGGETLIKAGDM